MSSLTTNAKSEDWEITVTRVDGLSTGELERIRVPQSRVNEIQLACFIKSLMARHSGYSAAELLPRFVNRRRGNPQRHDSWDVRRFTDLEKNSYGYFCGEHPIFASASLPMSKAHRQLYIQSLKDNGIINNV
jgi:hypothetical protein